MYVEQNVGLLLAILESPSEVARALHPPLMKLGLPSVLIDLLAFEMNKLLCERIPERYKLTSILVKLFVDNFNVTTKLKIFAVFFCGGGGVISYCCL